MQVTLVQIEIETAIRDYLRSELKFVVAEDAKVAISATRGAAGYTATVNVEPRQKAGGPEV